MSKNNYIARRLHDKSDVDIVVDGLKNRQNVLLLGPRGTGKTSLSENAANKLGLELITVPCHTGATAEELIGQWVPKQDGGGFTWMDGLVTTAVRHGKVLFLDEVNSLRPEVAFAIHGLLDHRRELVLLGKPNANGSPEVIKAHASFGMIAAGNPSYEGVRVMNEAFRDRFAVQILFGYVTEMDQAVIAASPTNALLSADNRAAMAFFISKLRLAIKNKAIYSDVSTRAFLDFQQNFHIHTPKVAFTLLLSRFDDEAERAAVRTVVREVWDDRGVVMPAALQSAKTSGKTGRAGKFATNATPDMQDAADQTFTQ